MTHETEPLPQVGERLVHRSQLRALPSGSTVFGNTTGATYTKVGDDYYVVTAAGRPARQPVGHRRAITSMRASLYTVHTIGDTTVPPPSDGFTLPDDIEQQTIEMMETLTQYKARFFTGIWGSALRAGIYENEIDDTMTRLEVAPEPSIGMPVNMFDGVTIDALPQYSTLVFGTVQRDLNRWAVYGKPSRPGEYGHSDARHALNRIAGARNVTHAVFGHVECAPGWERMAWVDEVGTVDDLGAIHAFKRKAHAFGARMKSSHGWCSEYEASMLRVDIPPNLERAQPLVVTAAEAAGYPPGTWFRHTGKRNDTRLYVRDNASPNPARTVGVGGVATGHWAEHMEHVAAPGDRLQIRVASGDEADSMPVGTRMQLRDRGGSYYEKREDGRWNLSNYAGYTYMTSDLTVVENSMVYTHIPWRNA